MKISAGMSMRCLAIHTYGIVMGLSSFKMLINTTENILEAKLPINIAIEVDIEYCSVYPLLVYISKYLVI